MNNILIVVREDKLASTLSMACQDRGANVIRALGATAQALPEISAPSGSRKWLGLFLELGHQGKPQEMVASFLEANPDLKIVVLSKKIDVKSMASLLRQGVVDCLEIPLDPLELSHCLDKLLGRLGAQKQESYSPRETPPAVKITPVTPTNDDRFSYIVGRSAALKKVFKLVDKVASTDSTVMIHGESGTGKELLVRAIHSNSSRKDKPLIPVNCGAIPEELLEAELFGHEKGAFTNAIRTRIGRFEMANEGTIFLDEIGDMSSKLQVKLLRVLQEHEIERVGGDKIIPVDIRVLTATHVDLSKAVEEGRFREDLYYRLNVIPVTMPPLRNRLDDVPLLVNYFLKRLRETRNSEITGIDQEVLNRFLSYGWPGNVRELENLMERMVTLADDPVLTVDDLPAKLLAATEGITPPELPTLTPELAFKLHEFESDDSSGPSDPKTDIPTESGTDTQPVPVALPNPDLLTAEPPAQVGSISQVSLTPPTTPFPLEGVDFNALVSAYEEQLIRGALEVAGGVKNQAAKLLGLNRTTLVEKMRKKGLTVD